MKKFFTIILSLTVGVIASAQYKVSSFDSAFSPEFELKYVLEAEISTIIYGSFTSSDACQIFLDREMAVIQDDLKYKVKNGVNIPVYDEANKMYAVFGGAGEKVNFVLEFEKFPLHDGFDIVENEKPREGGVFLNVYGIHLEPMELERFPDFDKFLDSYPPVLFGKYVENGGTHQYYMKGNIYISCQCTDVDDGFLEPKYKRFYIEVNNDSDHGVLFNFDDTYVQGHRTVGGKLQEKYFTKYTPESFDSYMAQNDYEEARRAVGGMKDVGSKLRTESYNKSNSEWANLGLKVLGDLADEIAEKNIQQYLAEHPKSRPSALRSQSLKSGESVCGYLAFKSQKADTFTLHIPMDGYDFTFNWK